MNGSAADATAALSAFDAATAADSTNLDAQRRTGELFLARHGNEDSRSSYNAVLRRAPDDARALLGLARVEDYEGKGSALATVRRSLAADPNLADALSFAARLHLESERYDSARVYAARALASDSSSLDAWSLLGATAWMTGDSATFKRARAAATVLQPRPAQFYTELAEASIRQRRYANVNELAKQAVALDSTATHALLVLGTNQLRLGQMADGKATLDRVFALDPSDARTKNMLDLLDVMRTYKTTDRGRFRIVAPPAEAELLTLYIVPLLERAYDTLSLRYAFKPATPVRLEFFSRSADFSVRTLGAVGLGALGVSFGNLLAMDAPSARERGSFNWGSTAWHELTHAFTLGASDFRVPRWLSEGMSVYEERRAQPGWGASETVSFVSALGSNVLRPMSSLSEGFLHPRFPEETQFSYYQASLFCEMAVQLKGEKVLSAMLVGYRDGLDTPAVFQRALGVSAAQVDAQFDQWMRTKFAIPLKTVVSSDSANKRTGAFQTTMQRAMSQLESGKKDSARVSLERALGMFPEYAGTDGAAWYLAQLQRDRADTTAAIRSVSMVTTRNEVAWDANLLEANLREKTGDAAGAMQALQRLLWISPYDPQIHARLAQLATSRKDFALAVQERRAIIALHPTDELDARVELAKALAAGGDVASARREVLQVLEQAPSFEKAQALLLELRARAAPGANPDAP
jgi:tetratricopeptide (TPR) repeat protein